MTDEPQYRGIRFDERIYVDEKLILPAERIESLETAVKALEIDAITKKLNEIIERIEKIEKTIGEPK